MNCQAPTASPTGLRCSTRASSAQLEPKTKSKRVRIREFDSSWIAFRTISHKRPQCPLTSKNTCRLRRHECDNRGKSRRFRTGMFCDPGIHRHLPHKLADERGDGSVQDLSSLCGWT